MQTVSHDTRYKKNQATPSRRSGVVYNHVIRMRSEAAAKDESNRREIKSYIWGDKPPELDAHVEEEIVKRVYSMLKKENSAVLDYFGKEEGRGLSILPRELRREFEKIIGAQVRKGSIGT